MRDRNRPEKTDHLLALNDDTRPRGNVTIHEADLHEPGSYDQPFARCAAVVHAGAAVGDNRNKADGSWSDEMIPRNRDIA